MRFDPTIATPPDPTDDADQTDLIGNAAEESKELIEAFFEALPRLGLGLLIIVAAVVLGKVVRSLLQPRLSKRRTESFGRVMSRLVGWAIIAAGLFIGLTAIFPSIKPVDLIAGLGVFSIAIGFAFQDILSNLLAGILLLIREPFHTGDQIEVSGQRGTVQAITIRETQIKTFDGEKIIIPNAEVYQSVLRVQTAYGPKRTTLVIGLDDWADLDAAAEVITGALDGIDGIERDPAPQAYFFEFGDSTTNLQVRYWTQPEQSEVRRVQDAVVRSIGKALKESEIPMPSPIRELDVRASVGEVFGGDGSAEASS